LKLHKPEIRILGVEEALELGEDILTTCVVMRGSLQLDGVFVSLHRKGDPRSLALSLKTSPYFKELRVVMLSSKLLDQASLDEVYEVLRLPTMLLSHDGMKWRLLRFKGLNTEEASSILSIASSDEGPEALRLARMLSPMVKELANSWLRSSLYLRRKEGKP